MVPYINIVFIVSFLMLLVASKPGENARRITLLLEQSTRLNCSTDPIHPVKWYHKPVGVEFPNLVYASSNIYGFYGSRGRHKIAEGTYDLLISNATEDESGVYFCKEADTGTDWDSYDVMVLKSHLHCSPNRSLSDLLVENDCNLTPDYVQLSCSVSYRGNFAPVLQWRHSAQLVSMPTFPNRENSVATSTLHLKPEFHMNLTHFICYVEDFNFDSQIDTCSTENITIAYIFHPTTKISEDTNTVDCIANTSSQHCGYGWYGTHVPTNVNIVSSNRTLQLDESLNNLLVRCETKCRIRGDWCNVTSSVTTSSTLPKTKSREGYSIAWIILSVVLVVLVVQTAFVAAYFIRKYKSQLEIQDEAVNGEVPLLSFSCSPRFSDTTFRGFDKTDMPMLLEYLDAVNGLADNLHSKGLLKEGDCYRLANISSYEDQAKDLLDMLKSRMKNESERNDFLKALEETDQKHICNELNSIKDASIRILNDEELFCIQKNYTCLLDLINPQDFFIDLLIGNRCITKQQGNRIKQQAGNWNARNRELIAILRRRSFAHFLAFKNALKETQPNVFKILDKIETSVVRLHCLSSIETSVDDVARVESNICESLNNPHQLSEAEQRDITSQFKGLTDNGVEFVGSSPTGSIVVYFLCGSFEAVIFLKKSYDLGELQKILEAVFNIVAQSAIHSTVEVNLEKTIYKQSISEARKTMYYNNIEKKTIYPDIMLLPAEMSKMILKKASILCCSAELGNTHMNTTTSKALFKKAGILACIILKSVSYEWMSICDLKSLFRQGCFPKQQLLDAAQTAKEKDQCESNNRNQQTEESQTHNLKTSQERVQEKTSIDSTAPEAFAIVSNTPEHLPSIDECKANMAEFLNHHHHHQRLTSVAPTSHNKREM